VGGALAIVVPGALLANQPTFPQGLRTSVLIAAGVGVRGTEVGVPRNGSATGSPMGDPLRGTANSSGLPAKKTSNDRETAGVAAV
jgi:hypothetical protein